MHLLDTDVLWALRGQTDGQDAAVFEWAATLMPTTVFISAATLMDLEGAAAKLDRKDKGGASALHDWVGGKVRPAFADRILAIDEKIVGRWARLGYMDLRDGLIAATALEHGVTVATRTPAIYKQGKVRTFNPWTYSPDAELDWRQASQSAPLWLKSLFVRG